MRVHHTRCAASCLASCSNAWLSGMGVFFDIRCLCLVLKSELDVLYNGTA